MQNRYFGDVGDFGKYGLLRKLSGLTAEGRHLSLGIVWYLVADEGHNNDGMHISYLQNPEYRTCDPDLFDGLKSLLVDGRRAVSKIQKSDLLPAGTNFVDTALSFKEMGMGGNANRTARLGLRRKWLLNAFEAVRDKDIVFLDPDNGFQIKSVQKHSDKGAKYVFWDEVQFFSSHSRTLVVYHHLNRTMPSRNQIAVKMQEFEDNLPDSDVIPLLFRRGSHRVFFIVPSKTQTRLIKCRVSELVNSHWAPHFEVCRS